MARSEELSAINVVTSGKNSEINIEVPAEKCEPGIVKSRPIHGENQNSVLLKMDTAILIILLGERHVSRSYEEMPLGIGDTIIEGLCHQLKSTQS